MSITTALQSETFGYIGAAVAVLFFGSNYVVAKKYPTGDGLAFQWVCRCLSPWCALSLSLFSALSL
jgi:Transmembrane family, TMEM144 of transporters